MNFNLLFSISLTIQFDETYTVWFDCVFIEDCILKYCPLHYIDGLLRTTLSQ